MYASLQRGYDESRNELLAATQLTLLYPWGMKQCIGKSGKQKSDMVKRAAERSPERSIKAIKMTF
jgi:hypothetical protein